MTDPFRPHRPTPATFPRERLLRAGVTEESVDALAQHYDGLDHRQRTDLSRWVNSRSDAAILERFGAEPVQPPADTSSPVTYETLNAETVDDLEDRIRAWNQAHPDEHLTTSGRKAELIGRLLDAYEGEASARASSSPLVVDPAATPTGGGVPAEPVTTTTDAPAPAAEVLPTAPTPTDTTGAPTTTDAAGAGSTTTTTEGTTTT